MQKVKKENKEFDFRTINSVDAALNRVDEATRQEYLKSIEGYNTPDELAYKEKKLVAKAIRGDWEPDWENRNEFKWEAIFRWVSGSGFVFSCSFYYCTHSFSHVGSRFCFPTKEMSDYFSEQFIAIHRIHMTIQK